jgi:hypothetical protein
VLVCVECVLCVLCVCVREPCVRLLSRIGIGGRVGLATTYKKAKWIRNLNVLSGTPLLLECLPYVLVNDLVKLHFLTQLV